MVERLSDVVVASACVLSFLAGWQVGKPNYFEQFALGWVNAHCHVTAVVVAGDPGHAQKLTGFDCSESELKPEYRNKKPKG